VSLAAPLRLSLQAPRRVPAGGLGVRGLWRDREAVRIRLQDGEGGWGLGEALPLPGYSRDDAAAAERVLGELAATLSTRGLRVPSGPAGAPLIDAVLAPHAEVLAASTSARFALECALLDLLARRDGRSAAAWLAGGRALQAVPVSVLLPEAEDAAIAEAAAAAARGHTVLKLKIARPDRSASQEDALLAAVRAAADAGAGGLRQVRLRLDANGALCPDEAVPRLTALRRHGVELVEEPVAGAALLALPPLPLAWAADESLADGALADALLALPPGLRPAALVLKPAQLGLARCLRLADAAAGRGVGVIVTHSLDGDLGHAAACALALALPQPPWPCGLAPHPGLRHPPPATPWLPLPTEPGLAVPDWDRAA
jgi:L-alanine-DL-glutamate epimerase-like enolase superfamily enzyme